MWKYLMGQLLLCCLLLGTSVSGLCAEEPLLQ